MCFSASASFGAGAVLSVIGAASIKKAKTKTHLSFAAIPLIFAVQQITEGFLWLSFSKPELTFLQQPTTYLFLFFAQIVWPIWVPFSVILLEPKEKRRLAEKILVGLGAVVTLYLAYCLIVFSVKAQVQGYHIAYIQEYPAAISRYCGFLYVIATVAPPLFSRIKRMWILGTTILISYIITAIFYSDYIVSVWCFFASIISIAVLAIVFQLNSLKKN